MSAIGSCLKAPFNQLIDSLFCGKKENLIRKISDKATVIFGILMLLTLTSALGLSIKCGINGGVEWLFSVITRTKYTPSPSAEFDLFSLQVDLIMTVAAAVLFGVAAFIRHQLHRTNS